MQTLCVPRAQSEPGAGSPRSGPAGMQVNRAKLFQLREEGKREGEGEKGKAKERRKSWEVWGGKSWSVRGGISLEIFAG